MKFLFIVFALLSQVYLVISHGHTHNHVGDHHHSHDEPPAFKYSREANQKPTPKTMDARQIWIETIIAVTLISLAPAFVLKLIPDLAKNEKLLKVLLGFTAGGLLGDAFFHLLPHAMHGHVHEHEEHAHSHSMSDPHMQTSIYVLAGILFFLLVEKLIRLIKEDSGHSHGNLSPAQKSKKTDSKVIEKKIGFQVSGYLNLAADFAHNFTDGLAIAASFTVSRNVGIVTTLTVLVHELPHEIGDYAILISAGCSSNKAIMLQLVTAIGAFAGASLSLISAGLCPSSLFMGSIQGSNLSLAIQSEKMTATILPFTAGGFIYIALVTVMPELLSTSRKHGLVQSILELLALLVGVGLMIVVSLYE